MTFAQIAGAAGPFFNGIFSADAPGNASGFATEDAFPNLTFIDPLWMTEIPGSGELAVLVKGGQIWRFPNNPAVTPAQRTLVVDISDRLQIATELGLLRMVFHPQFGQAGSAHANEVFLCYSHRPPGTTASGTHNMWRVSRFQWQPATGTIDPASEEVLIQQYDPNTWHNAGALAFDNDGFLLITCGDGGGANNEYGLAQRVNHALFSGVLRIDVDNDPARSHPIRRQPADPSGKPSNYPASFTQGYGIPNDNPFLDPAGGVLEEFYALGLRSPHSAHYDVTTGEFWIADVGQTRAEELNLLRKGANFQWAYREGTDFGYSSQPGASQLWGVETPPVYSYGRSVGSAIIGGIRYRGAKWAADFAGDIIIGDNIKCNLSSVTLKPGGGTPFVKEIAPGVGSGLFSGISNLATDSAGEIYALRLYGVGLDGGKILKLVRTGTLPEPPQFLSATGLFSNLATLQPAAGLVPYQINSPLWSDGAEKQRWIALPDASKIGFRENDNMVFPTGTVFVKHFEIPVDERDPSMVKRLETRVMVCVAGGDKYGLTYKWNAEGTEATLLTAGLEEDFTVTLADGGSQLRKWSYPSRADCMTCHTPETGQSLGFRTHQLSLLVPASGSLPAGNQIIRLNNSGFFNASPALTAAVVDGYLRAAPLDDPSASLEHRVRSYLDSNCSHCHRPDGSAPFFDARLTTPLLGQNLVEGLISGHFSMDPEGRYLKPANPSLSAIHVRAASAVPGVAMPPLGKHVVDQAASDLIHEYISSLTPQEFAASGTGTATRYLRLTSLTGTVASVAEFIVLDDRGFPIPRQQLSVAAVSSATSLGGGQAAIDGDNSTIWRTPTRPAPHFITLDLGSVREIGGFIYVPNTASVGRISDYEVHYSPDGSLWTLATKGRWQPNSNATVRYDRLNDPRKVRPLITAASPGSGAFPVSFDFDSSVEDFTAEDVVVEGGVMSLFRGKGHRYTAVVTPEVLTSETTVNIRLGEDSVAASDVGSHSATLAVISRDIELAPGVFETAVRGIDGQFQVPLAFSELVTGLDPSDFQVENGRVTGISGSGANYLISVSADRFTAPVVLRLMPGGFTDPSGNPAKETGPTYHHEQGNSWLHLSSMASNASTTSGFVNGYDNIGGVWSSFIHVPEGSRGGDTQAVPEFHASYGFIVPRPGEYILRGLVRANDAESDSFHFSIDGMDPPKVWNIDPDEGEVGDGSFHWCTAKDVGEGDRFHLDAGYHTVHLYAREDGAQIASIALESIRPLVIWKDGPVAVTTRPFQADVTFSPAVSGLVSDDIEISGGQVTAIEGDGASYRLTIVPSAEEILIQIPEGRVETEGGITNLASPIWRFLYQPPYETWAKLAGVDSSPESHLADPDRDGVVQLLEFAFGFDPKRPDATGSGYYYLPVVTLEGSASDKRLRMLYRRRKGVQGLAYTPQFSTGLGSWTDSTTASVVEHLDSTWERVIVTDQAGAGSERSRFGRIKVEFSPP